MLNLLLAFALASSPITAAPITPMSAATRSPVPPAWVAPMDTVHGYSATSPNGELELQVRPEDRDGEGGATYTLLDDGEFEILFSKEETARFVAALLADSGTARNAMAHVDIGKTESFAPEDKAMLRGVPRRLEAEGP